MSQQTQCPEFSFFGAAYPDATCINGSLHDLDDGPDVGGVYLKDEDFPCPFCRPIDVVEKEYGEYDGGQYLSDGVEREECEQAVNSLRNRYGFEPFIFPTPQNQKTS